MAQMYRSLRRWALAAAMFSAASVQQAAIQADWCGGYDDEGCHSEAGLRCESTCQGQGSQWHCHSSVGWCEEFSCELDITCVS